VGGVPAGPSASTAGESPHEHTKTEPNALLTWATTTWESIKAGKIGNPRLIALFLAVVAVLGAWWFLARTSKQADSALWYKFDEVMSADQANKFAEEPTNAKTVAARYARFVALRLRKDAALNDLSSEKLLKRQTAADSLEKLRDELEGYASSFDSDPTAKSQALVAAADCEMALVGVPKKAVTVMGVDVKGNSRGRLDKFAELMRKAAEAIGPDTDAGKRLIAEGETYSKEPQASRAYARLGAMHAKFNNPDAVTNLPTDPSSPKTPGGLPETPKTDTATGEAPKPPTGNPFDEKK
jgi:Tfp pilus assembly protein PilV